MLIEALTLAAATHLGAALADLAREPVYARQARAVSNWRLEAIRALDLDAARTFAFATGSEPERLPRCVRLNNYWCIKSARWKGEIATDAEGHVAFASAQEGTAVAVNLLRRYYIDFNRKSALSIVSRWAPAECRALAPRAPSGSSPRADALTTRGIRNTARARFLARHGRGGVARPAKRSATKTARNRAPPGRVTHTSAPPSRVAMLRAPSIAVGMGERAPAREISIASLAPLPARGARPEPAVPRIACTGEALRIRNYASTIAASIKAANGDDLKLFEPDGTPTANLLPVLMAMASVEIGPFKVRRATVAAAIEALKPPAPAPQDSQQNQSATP